MNLQRNDTIIRRAQEQHMEGKVSLWILESPMITLGMGSQSASIVTNMDIWQRNAG